MIEDSDEDFSLLSRVFPEPPLRWGSAEDALHDLGTGGVDPSTLAFMLIDLDLPGIDGCDFVQRARLMDGMSDVVLCLLTGSHRAEDAARAITVGADGYLCKPQSITGLRAIPHLASALERPQTGPDQP